MADKLLGLEGLEYYHSKIQKEFNTINENIDTQIENITDGTTTVGNADKLDGKDADYFETEIDEKIESEPALDFNEALLPDFQESVDSLNTEISNLKSDLVQLETETESNLNNLWVTNYVKTTTLKPTWESGYIKDDGTDAPSEYAWRSGFYDCTDAIFSVDANATIHVEIPSEYASIYKFTIFYYNADDTLKGFMRGKLASEFTSQQIMNNSGDGKKYRVFIQHIDDSKVTNLTDDECNSIIIWDKTVTSTPNVNGTEELKNEIISDVNVFQTVTHKPYTFAEKSAVFFGDSITVGYIAPSTISEKPYPIVFGELVGLSNVYNYARNGSTFDRSNTGDHIYDTMSAWGSDAFKGDYLFISAGVNDWQFGVALEDFRNAVQEVCTLIKNRPYTGEVIFITPIDICGFTPTGTPTATLQEFRNVITELAIINGFAVVEGNEFNMPTPNDSVDYQTALTYDGLHLTQEGYKLYAYSLATKLN